jgi:hypothetical protein
MRSLGLLLGLALTAVAVAAVHGRVPMEPRAERDARFVPRPEVARVASLGFQPLVADFYWMQAVQVVGAEISNPARHGPLLGRLVDVVTTVDPWVGHPYRFAAHWMTGSAEDVRFANHLLERSLEYHPDDWRNPFYLGFNRFYYLGDNQGAADALDRAAGLPGAPSYVGRLVARLRADTAGLETSAAFLAELVRSSEDPQARAQYEAALQEIDTERRARFLDRAQQEFRQRAGRELAHIDELVRGPHAVLERLPAEPHGDVWELADDGRIVSRRLGRRYEPFIHENDLRRRESWSRQAEDGES